MSPAEAAWIVLLLPLLGSVVLGLGFKQWRGITAGVIGTASVGLAFVFTLVSLISMLGRDEAATRQISSSLYDYVSVGGVNVQMSILVDPLSLVMLLVVTGVSTLIHLYSVQYMRGDEGYVRFFAYLNFFVFSMLLLVLAGNFVILIIGWGLVGAAGVTTRRNPLLILVCLELMLNAGNLALIAFSRMVGNVEGQIFALIVMVVAACEVVIGLGIIVAMYRRKLPIDVDDMAELRG